MGFFDSLKNTVESFGKAVEAPLGVYYDLATAPFDNKDDDLSSIIGKVAKRASDVFDPLSNDKTITGFAFGKTMQGLNTVYQNAVDDPLSTAMIMASHASTGSTLGHWGTFFNSEDWGKAYAIAHDQHQSLGQSVAFAVSNEKDPFANDQAGKTPFQNVTEKDHPVLGTVGALAVDLGTSWYLDPAVLAGKGASVARASQLGKVKIADRGAFATTLETGKNASGVKTKDWGGRLDQYFDYISGNNHLKRPLNADEIYQSSTELKRSMAGKQIAGLLDDALKLPPEEAPNAMRRIMAVGVGDASQIKRLRAESQSGQAIADALDNMASGTTVKLAHQALRDDLRYSPELAADFDRQLQNLNSGGKISDFISDWRLKLADDESSISRMQASAGELDFVPGARKSANSTLKRLNGDRLITDKVLNSDVLVQKARDYAHRDSYSTVWQSGIHHMPLVAAHTVGLGLLPYRGTMAFVDALRLKHFTGVAKLDDWNNGVDQLDSMMRHAEVADNVRHGVLSAAYKASTEVDKTRAIEQAEGLSMRGIADMIHRKHGLDVDSNWVRATVTDGQVGRAKSMGRVDGGRIYATSKLPDDLALREKNLAKAKLQQRADLSSQSGNQKLSIAPEDALKEIDDTPLRADQILDENGLPVSLPLTVAQLGNRVPLMDVRMVKRLANDGAWASRFHQYGEAWKAERADLDGLEYQLKNTKVGNATRLERAVRAKRVTIDALQDAGSVATRVWKFSALFRLGYPVRILMDDHMRIANVLHYPTFLWSNGSEGGSNAWYNSRLNYRDGRYQQAATAFKVDQARKAGILTHLGLPKGAELTSEEWTSLRGAIANPDAKGSTAVLERLDPSAKIREHLDLAKQVQSHTASANGHRNAIARWKRELSEAETKHSLGINHGVDIPGLHKKIQSAEAAILDHEGARTLTMERLTEDSPEDLFAELSDLNARLAEGKKGYLPDKAHLGEQRGVQVDKNVRLSPAFAGSGAGYKNASSSEETTAAMIDTMEAHNLRLSSSGAHRTVTRDEPGYKYIYSQVLNYQFQHSPELMAFVKGEVETPADFAKWLAIPEHKYIRDRVTHYAADPEGWGARLQQVYQDYLPTPAIRRAVAKGSVSAKDIDRLVPREYQPAVHTDLADVNTGRHTAVRMVSDGMNRAMSWLATAPTDRLSRHPFFNSMYRQHANELYAVRKAEVAKGGGKLTSDDLAEIERTSRRKALNDVRQTLWDVSAHSHAAHTLRFISPFFAAHQEALTRWWRIATDDPSVVRKFQLAFDAPRKAGMTYDMQTGEPVPEGVAPSANHRIMLRLPGPLDSSANKWLKKVGGDKFWSVNENGFNLILQNGIANPGVGPVVSVPLESILRHYSTPELEKVVRGLNPYPPDSPMQGIVPAWYKRMHAITAGQDDPEFRNRLASNWADTITQYRLDHDGAVPNEQQYHKLMAKAVNETHKDLWIQMASNLTSPLPAKPESKFTVQQAGLSKILSQMRTGGHDWEWAAEQFSARYGDLYSAMMATQGVNPGHLDMNLATTDALKKRRGLLKNIDPKLYRMVVGPDAAQDAKADPRLGRYDQTAQAIMRKMKVSPTSNDTVIGFKSSDELAVKTMADAGWTQYEQLTNALTLAASQQGLASYEDSKQLVEMKRAGVAYISDHNFAFKHDWDSFNGDAEYDGLLGGMREIADSRQLQRDPGRAKQVYYLGQYLLLRDAVTAALKQRGASGGAKSIDASANSDLATVFFKGVQYLRDQSPDFDDYSYHGVIEHDPLLRPALEK